MFHVRAWALCAVLGLSLFTDGCGGGGGISSATPVMPSPAAGGAPANTPVQTPSATTDQSPATFGNTLVEGSVVALLRGGGMEINGGSHYGYVDLYPGSGTKLSYGGLQPRVGEFAVAVIGSFATPIRPLLIGLYSSAPPSVTQTATVYISEPYGLAIKLDSNGAYIPLGLTTQTSASGSTSDGAHVSVTGIGSVNTAIFASRVSGSGGGGGGGGSAPKHVMVAQSIYGYAGTPTSVPLGDITPYVNWTQTDSTHAPIARAAGIKVYLYLNFWRNYASDNPAVGYDDLRPGGAHAAAEAKECNGTVIYDSHYGGGYEANAESSKALGHAEVVASYAEREYAGNYDALFSDDTGAVLGLPLLCNFSLNAYQSATNTLDAELGKPMFVNTLGAWAPDTPSQQIGYAMSSNVIGAMGEGFYAENNGRDYVDLGAAWTGKENAEITAIANRKIFWDDVRAIGAAQDDIPARNYVIASFLLTYNPNYAMIETHFATPKTFSVMPETGLVPEQPENTQSSVAGYLQPGGAFMRQFGACYYRGQNEGSCAVVVNPNTYSVPIPTSAYGHSMVLSGSDVLDGGAVSFGGGRPASLPSGNGVVLFR